MLVDAEGEVKLGDWGYSARLVRRRGSEILRGAGAGMGMGMGTGGGGSSSGVVEEEETELVVTEREGDRDYLSPEGIRGVVGTAGDIFR